MDHELQRVRLDTTEFLLFLQFRSTLAIVSCITAKNFPQFLQALIRHVLHGKKHTETHVSIRTYQEPVLVRDLLKHPLTENEHLN